MTRLALTLGLLLLLAAPACGSPDQGRLCGEPNDNTGLVTDNGSKLIDLRTAECIARKEVGGDVVLYSLSSDTARPVGPDGLAESWGFGYRPNDPDSDIAWAVTVTADEVTSDEFFYPFLSGCAAEESLRPLDSRVVVPDAVSRLEQTDNPVRLAEAGRLYLRQALDCWYNAVPIDFYYTVQNAVTYDGTTTWSMLEYDDDGRFVSLFER